MTRVLKLVVEDKKAWTKLKKELCFEAECMSCNAVPFTLG